MGTVYQLTSTSATFSAQDLSRNAAQEAAVQAHGAGLDAEPAAHSAQLPAITADPRIARVGYDSSIVDAQCHSDRSFPGMDRPRNATYARHRLIYCAPLIILLIFKKYYIFAASEHWGTAEEPFEDPLTPDKLLVPMEVSG